MVESRGAVTRRTLTAGAVWSVSVPVVAVGWSARAAAASALAQCPSGDGASISVITGGSNDLTVQLRDVLNADSRSVRAGTPVTVTVTNATSYAVTATYTGAWFTVTPPTLTVAPHSSGIVTLILVMDDPPGGTALATATFTIDAPLNQGATIGVLTQITGTCDPVTTPAGGGGNKSINISSFYVHN